MKKKFLYILLSFIVLGLVFVLPTFAAEDINLNLNSGNQSATSSNNTSINTTQNTSYNSSYTPTAVISNTDEDFGLTNILNIMLIVIGILLVLLAIAILIRLKG